jgi:hypothetical protein
MRFLRALLLIGATSLAPGCNDKDGESTPPPETPESPNQSDALLEACSADRALDLLAVLGEIPDLVGAAQDAAASMPAPVPFPYDVAIDFDADGREEGRIRGEVALRADPRLGLVGVVSWSLSAVGIEGSGTLDLQFVPDAVEVRGRGTIARGGCTMDFDVDPMNPVLVSLGQLAEQPEPASGRVHLMISSGADTLAGTLTMEAGTISVREIALNGAGAPDLILH